MATKNHVVRKKIKKVAPVPSVSNDNIEEIEQRVADNVRNFRKLRGLSQKELAAILGVSFQQVQKYENGINRISAGKLPVLAEEFEVPLNIFFSETAAEDFLKIFMDKKKKKTATSMLSDLDSEIFSRCSSLPVMKKRMILQLIQEMEQ